MAAAQGFSSCGLRGLLCSCSARLLLVLASRRRARALGVLSSGCSSPGSGDAGAIIVALGSCPVAWDLPRSGDVSPCIGRQILSAEPPREACLSFLIKLRSGFRGPSYFHTHSAPGGDSGPGLSPQWVSGLVAPTLPPPACLPPGQRLLFQADSGSVCVCQ